MNNKLPENSPLMRALLAMGNVKLAWACRRLHCPVPASALVLEVGSGGSPYFRANVLIDAYVETRERHWAPFITDRPSVLGMGEALPFKDKSFDFVIASHVLEHSADPESFLRELQRVAKAGYIETPDAFMERINPYWDHRSEVTVRNEVLEVRKKPTWRVDSELVEMYEKKAKRLIAGLVIPSNPFTFHTRFYWKEHIPFRIVNPEVDSNWLPPDISHNTKQGKSLRTIFGKVVLAVFRSLFSQKNRNRNIDLKNLLQCPNCNSIEFVFKRDTASCENCKEEYHCISGIWDMSKNNNK
jgi:SAM-dependent methyltransferase